MHVQTMRKGNRGPFAQIVMHIFLVGVGLQFIGHGEHDQVAPSGRFGDAHDLEPLGLGFSGAGRTGAQCHHDIPGAAVAQVQRMGMALAAIAQNGDLLVLDQVHIAIAIIIDAHLFFSSDGGNQSARTMPWVRVFRRKEICIISEYGYNFIR